MSTNTSSSDEADSDVDVGVDVSGNNMDDHDVDGEIMSVELAPKKSKIATPQPEAIISV